MWLRVQYWSKCEFCFYRWEFTDIIFPFRYTQVLGDTMNIPLCGRLPIYWSAMCFDSLSAITVKYLFQLLTITAGYIPQGMSVYVYHYTRDATASLRGKLWISNIICISIINPDILPLQLRICNLTKFFLVHHFPLTPGGNEQHFSINSSLVLQFLGKRFISEIPNAIKHNPVLIFSGYLNMHSLWMFSSLLLNQIKELFYFKPKIWLGCMSKMYLLLLTYLITSASILSWRCGNTFLNNILNFHYNSIPFYKKTAMENDIYWHEIRQENIEVLRTCRFVHAICTKLLTVKHGSKPTVHYTAQYIIQSSQQNSLIWFKIPLFYKHKFTAAKLLKWCYLYYTVPNWLL